MTNHSGRDGILLSFQLRILSLTPPFPFHCSDCGPGKPQLMDNSSASCQPLTQLLGFWCLLGGAIHLTFLRQSFPCLKSPQCLSVSYKTNSPAWPLPVWPPLSPPQHTPLHYLVTLTTSCFRSTSSPSCIASLPLLPNPMFLHGLVFKVSSTHPVDYDLVFSLVAHGFCHFPQFTVPRTGLRSLQVPKGVVTCHGTLCWGWKFGPLYWGSRSFCGCWRVPTTKFAARKPERYQMRQASLGG